MARVTTATGYVALGLLAFTLLIGPANLLLRRQNPVSNYLRRDAGAWTAIVSVAHVIVGLQVHGPPPPASLGERILRYFFGPDGNPLTNSFGLGNWTGLAATVIAVGLLAISSDFALRKLKAGPWKWLQRLNYALFALVVAHAIFYGALLRVTSPSTLLLGLSVIAVFVGQAVGAWLWRRRFEMRVRPVVSSMAMLASASLMPTLGSAQEIGVLKGLNSSNIGFKGVNASVDRRTGVAGGKYYCQVIHGKLSVEFDALIAMKGTEFDFGAGDTGKAKLAYLDIPVLARVNMPASAAARVHLFAGPSFNFKLSGSFDREGTGGDEEIKIFETAFVIGGGVTVNRFRIDARYGWGLTNIAKEQDFTAKNRVFSILLGLVLKKAPARTPNALRSGH